MNLASVAFAPISAPVHAAPAVATTPAAPRPLRFASSQPAPASWPVALEGATDGAARTAAPVFDFPGILAGDVFDIVKGSKAGPIGVRGEATVEELTADRARFHVVAGALGRKADVTVQIAQVSEDQVLITSTGKGMAPAQELARIVERRTNHVVFEQVSNPANRTVLTHDGSGRVVIDAQIPSVGDTHLELQKRGSEA